MSEDDDKHILGSARLWRAGCGILPQRTLTDLPKHLSSAPKVRDPLESIARTLKACAPQKYRSHNAS